MEAARTIIAILIGIVIIILIVLLAKWTGDQIRQKLILPKPPVTTPGNLPGTANPLPTIPSTTTPEIPGTTGPTTGVPTTTPAAPGQTRPSTLAAIPSTGPNDFLYPLLAILFLSGVSALLVARQPVIRLQ